MTEPIKVTLPVTATLGNYGTALCEIDTWHQPNCQLFSMGGRTFVGEDAAVLCDCNKKIGEARIVGAVTPHKQEP